MDLFRRRVGPNAETGQGPHLGPAWQNPDRQSDWQGLGPYLDRGAGLLPAWRPCPSHPPHHRPQRTQGERKGFKEPDFARLLDAAHQQLGRPIVLIWDNLNGHISVDMRQAIAARSWLRVYRLPGYAPELNAAEGVWSHLKRSLANIAVTNIDAMARLVKTRLKQMQYRPGLIDGFLAATGLRPP
ncbi:transposase [Allorhizocola rhizosphaerae]|uniref:transposase n=1 Tax=Allorhizocola rhizosphaerae TaxID=1872709 RepID=UPI001FE35316|nr:transposase [Allorhizocola rhizosphaerae]